MSKPVRQALYQSQSIGGPAGNVVSVGPGFFIRGFEVDNLSGAWLYNPATGQYIAPYTLGYASTLRPAVSSMTIQYVAFGPNSQPSDNTNGSPFTLTVYDSPILNANGQAFLSPNDTRSLSFSSAIIINTGALAFAAFGIRVDNNTGSWYQIGTTGILIPPFTSGFTADLLPPVTSLVVAATPPPFGPPNTTTGTVISIILYPNRVGNSPGSTRIQTQSSQTFLASGTFIVPAGVTYLNIYAIGGGGYGGQATAVLGGGGGGCGGIAYYNTRPVTPGSLLIVTIGVVGASTIVTGPNSLNVGAGAGGNGGGAGGSQTTGASGLTYGISQGSGGGGAGYTAGAGGGGGGSGGIGQAAGNGAGYASGVGTYNGGYGSSNVANGGGGGIGNAAGGGGGGAIGSLGGLGDGAGFGNGGNANTAGGVGRANSGSGGGGGGAGVSLAAGGAGGTGIVVFSWVT